MEENSEILKLRLRVAETEAALQRERNRANLLASEMAQLRLSNTVVCTSIPPARSYFDSDERSDMVLVPRATLDLLHLKERAMDAAREGITIADARAPDMPLIYVNEGFSRITGYPVEFTVGKNCRFLQGPATEQETVRLLRQAMNTGQPCVVQITNYRRSGDPFINYLSLTPVHDASGIVTHYVGVQSDITELVQRRQAELAAKHAAAEASAATEAKSQFLARMSHEIRTPLNGMIAVGQLLAESQLTPSQWDLVNTIRCSGEALLTLITDILDFSKIEANKMVLSQAPFFLESTIEAAMEIAGLHAAKKRLQVAYHIAPGVPRWIVGDAQRLQQVLLNILNNALKFTDSGEVLLEIWTQPIRPTSPVEPIQAACAQRDSPTLELEELCEVHFSVRDTGIGISGPDLLRLFQSFSQVDASPTRRFGGSGLGLTISQKLCEAMGGRMWAESAGLGHGSSFRWCIRARRGADEPSPPERLVVPYIDASSLQALRGLRVLLIEPCDMVRQVMLLVLRQWGCQVAAVDSEPAALARLTFHDDARVAVPRLSLCCSATTPKRSNPSRLGLTHAGTEDLRDALAASAACQGPYDVVVMDITHSVVLNALVDAAAPEEARRVVFFGWPGSSELADHDRYNNEDHDLPTGLPSSPIEESNKVTDVDIYSGVRGSLPAEAPPPAYASAYPNVAIVPRPPRGVAVEGATLEGTTQTSNSRQPSSTHRRRLGYVMVSRPVRQGRLKLGLCEVMEMKLNQEENEEEEEDAAELRAVRTNEKVAMDSVPLSISPPRSPRTAPSNDRGVLDEGDSRSEAAGSATESSGFPRSLGSGGSVLMQAMRVPRVSSGSSLTTADGGLVAFDGGKNASRKLLLAEDNAINMKVALGILRRLGFTNVVTAPDGVAAVEAVAAAGGPAAFDAILMDLHMPRKGGIEAVQDIRRAWPLQQTKIIAVTADAFEDTRDVCIAQGFTGWLAKPFRVEEFARVMGEG